MALMSNVCTVPFSNEDTENLLLNHACGASIAHHDLVSMHVGDTGRRECNVALQPDAPHLLPNKQALQHS